VALGIREKVVFTGFAADTRFAQTLFDVQVFPSLYEGTPLALIEAMAMGRAIVSTDVDGLGEVLEHERTALLVPPRNAEALAAAIARLLASPGRARALGAAAEVEAQNYDIGNAVRAMERIYEDLMPAPRPAGRDPARAWGEHPHRG
jgi:glycosyltransferase involved in cell wall biosynthesis